MKPDRRAICEPRSMQNSHSMIVEVFSRARIFRRFSTRLTLAVACSSLRIPPSSAGTWAYSAIGSMPFSGRRRWLTTVVARICLNALRARRSRAEEPLEAYVPEPLVSAESGVDPEYETLLADALGLALQVVLETLEPAERLAYVLHDMFAVPFEEIARMVERSPAATRQLASRARRRVQGAPTAPDPDLARQRAVVDAFFAAQRSRADAFEDRAFRALGDRRRLRRQARPDIKGGLDARAIASVALRASRASGRDGPYHASGLCTQRHQFAYTARDRRMRPHAAGTAEGMTPGGLPDARTAYPRSHRRHG